jgi:hypothetical protein
MKYCSVAIFSERNLDNKRLLHDIFNQTRNKNIYKMNKGNSLKDLFFTICPFKDLFCNIKVNAWKRSSNVHALIKKRRPFTDCICMYELDEIKGVDIGETYRNEKQVVNFAHYIAKTEKQKLVDQINESKQSVNGRLFFIKAWTLRNRFVILLNTFLFNDCTIMHKIVFLSN